MHNVQWIVIINSQTFNYGSVKMKSVGICDGLFCDLKSLKNTFYVFIIFINSIRSAVIHFDLLIIKNWFQLYIYIFCECIFLSNIEVELIVSYRSRVDSSLFVCTIINKMKKKTKTGKDIMWRQNYCTFFLHYFTFHNDGSFHTHQYSVCGWNSKNYYYSS